MRMTIHDDWWSKEFSPAVDRGVDYISRDGKTAVEVQQASYGSRGLYSAVMQLAIFLERNQGVERGCLVLSRSRMSLDRLKEEWQSSIGVLRSTTANRLSLVVVDNGKTWIEPNDTYLRRVAHVFELASQADSPGRCEFLRQQPGQKPYEVLKVLMNRWLRKQGPIAIGELAKEVGCSYPTVRKSLGKTSLRHALRTTSNRSVELQAFPHDAWKELLAFVHTMRISFRFQDRSGDKPTPQGLKKRLEKMKPPQISPAQIALGGVVAARHWHPDFDLNGIPRLDLVLHAPNGKVDLSFVQRIDPALIRVDDPSTSAVLVVHALTRKTPLFAENSSGVFPWADPVETVLDLYDLSLTVQANQLLTHLRPETRLG